MTDVQVLLDEHKRYSHLWCFDCDKRIDNTANHEMRREGVYSHSHSCKKKEKNEKT